MRNFHDCLIESGLGPVFDASHYANYGKFTQEAADLLIQIQQLEKINLELLAVTFLNESTFNIYSPPNTNGNNANYFGFDIGMGQLNLGWTLRMAWQGELKTNDLLFVDVFGKPPYIPEALFTGNPLAHGRIVARRLLSRKGDDRTRAMMYTGPNAREYRGQSYDKFAPLFEKFFDFYSRKV